MIKGIQKYLTTSSRNFFIYPLKVKDAILSALVFLVIYIAGAYDFTLNTYIIALFMCRSPVSRCHSEPSRYAQDKLREESVPFPVIPAEAGIQNRAQPLLT